MVQAILAGRKTQTRRLITPGQSGMCSIPKARLDWNGDVFPNGSFGVKLRELADPELLWRVAPKALVGDIIWVRESFAPVGHAELPYRYRADHLNPYSVRWKPSIHMPLAAARIWLRCTGVKAERVQDISTADIMAEGVQVPCSEDDTVLWSLGDQNSTLSLRYELEDTCGRTGEDFVMFVHWAKLWIDINGRESWDANPWVWAYSFDVLSTTGLADAIMNNARRNGHKDMMKMTMVPKELHGAEIHNDSSSTAISLRSKI